MRRYKSIDLLKGIAIIMIILVHYESSFNCFPYMSYLRMGCPIFFVCSGFSISNLINKKYCNSFTKNQILDFYTNRIKSIIPGWYLAFFLFYISNSLCLLLENHLLNFAYKRDFISIIINLLLLNGLFPFCNNNVIPGGWFVGSLVILYFFTPFIISLVNKSKNRRLFFIISSIIDMSLWLIFYFLFSVIWKEYAGYSYFIFFVHFPSYLLGILLNYKIKNENVVQNKKTDLYYGLCIFVLAWVLYFVDFPFNNFISSWMTALSTYLILRWLIRKEKSGEACKNSKIYDLLSKYGQKTYGIYLTHALVVWTFVESINKLLCFYDLTIYTKLGFTIMLPIVIILSYFTGNYFILISNKFQAILFDQKK